MNNVRGVEDKENETKNGLMDPRGTSKRMLKNLVYFEELAPRQTECDRFATKFALQRRADAIIPT